jgi:molybdate transport system substrate-binding protein
MPQISEIKILSTHAVVEVLAELAPAFERAKGCTLSFHYNPTAVTQREIESGVAFDVAVILKSTLDELAARGIIMRDSCVELARCGLGVSVRAGAKKPDISSVEKFKAALLEAKSVVRSRDGASGKAFEAMTERLGITEALRDKIVIGGAGRIAELVARGEGELAVQQVPELVPVKGADYVGPWPHELQTYSLFGAGISAASQQREAAQAFIAALAAPANAALYKAKGLEPVAR